MLGEAIMGLSALNTAFNMAKGLKDIDDTVRRNAAVIELQENILAAQQAQAALIERIGELERKVADFETWERQKERYELKKLPVAVYLYALKDGVTPAEPPHYACPKCYEHRKRSVLHGSAVESGIETFHCHECDSRFHVGHYRSSPIEYPDNNYI